MKPIDRRNFIHSVGAGAVGLGAPGPWITRALAQNSPNDTINVAVMGIRSQGKSHLRNFARISGVNVTVICDIDERLLPKAISELEEISGKRVKTETDIRRVIDDKDVDVISIASPNHWHALTTVWACQAGKDVYVEKPVSHNIVEGRKMIEAALKYDCIVQTGTQFRSDPILHSAIDFIHSGKLGKVHMVKCVFFRCRESIGRGKITPVPEGVHYDLFRGPAPFIPFNENRFHYNWHWFWDTGNGENGNNGVHYTDMARWILRKDEHPLKIQSMGGVFREDTEQETPDTQISCMEYADGTIVQLEIRNLPSNSDANVKQGIIVYGSEGWLSYKRNQGIWATFFGSKDEPGPSMNVEDTGEKFCPLNLRATGGYPHFKNFIECVRSRNRNDLASDIFEGHLSASMSHLCNIAYRTGRTLTFDSKSERFIGDDEAQSYLSRDYRKPFVMPEKI